MTYLLRIGEFSKLGKTTIKTLRYYDECGLLKPDKVDVFNNYRYYSTSQLVELYEIQSLRACGLTIQEILEVRRGADVRNVLKQKRARLNEDMVHIQNCISRLDYLLSGDGVEVNIKMSYSVVIKDIPECIVFSKTGCAKCYADFMSLIPEIGAEVAKANPTLKCASPDYCFMQYLDKGYREENVRYEYCQAVESFGVETDSIKFKKLEKVTVASVLHKGSYSDLGAAYAFIFEWIEKNGYEVVAPPRECYIDGIWNRESEADWLTEIQVPVIHKV